jgi:tRNA(Ile)-lysidine synthase
MANRNTEETLSAYKPPGGLSLFARKLFRSWEELELPRAGEPIVIAVSGGADSVAMLLAVEELSGAGRLKASVVAGHFDHGLRQESSKDAVWVKALAESLGFTALVGSGNVAEQAGVSRDNLEQAARRARYAFLHQAALETGARFVLTAHTLDDQAETVLMRLVRGSGTDGLVGVAQKRPLEWSDHVQLVRPLLSWARRLDTESYCKERGVQFRLDTMNEDEEFSRVYIRKKVIPLLEKLNPKAARNIGRAALLFREDSSALGADARRVVEEAKAVNGVPERTEARISVEILSAAPAAVRRRAIRIWLAEQRGDLRRIERVHLLSVERLLSPGRGGRVAELPGGGTVERRGQFLLFNGKNR